MTTWLGAHSADSKAPKFRVDSREPSDGTSTDIRTRLGRGDRVEFDLPRAHLGCTAVGLVVHGVRVNDRGVGDVTDVPSTGRATASPDVEGLNTSTGQFELPRAHSWSTSGVPILRPIHGISSATGWTVSYEKDSLNWGRCLSTLVKGGDRFELPRQGSRKDDLIPGGNSRPPFSSRSHKRGVVPIA